MWYYNTQYNYENYVDLDELCSYLPSVFTSCLLEDISI